MCPAAIQENANVNMGDPDFKTKHSRQDLGFMRRVLRLAAGGQGNVSPNPLVGAILVKRGKIVGEGYHAEFGGPHAEVAALREAGDAARGADMFVNLEPCTHQGKTPPCADAIIEAGLRRVVIAMVDPFSEVSGRGIARLREAGVKVQVGLLEDEARELNRGFIKRVRAGRPFVALKIAQTMDGRTATRTGESKWITGEEARREGHRQRARHDAIVTGIGTVLADDPSLTVRYARGPNPQRIVIDPALRTPPDAGLVTSARKTPTTIIVGSAVDEARWAEMQDRGVSIRVGPYDAAGRLDIAAFVRRLGAEGVNTLMVEAGSRLTTSFMRAEMADRLLLFLAPRLLGDGRPAIGDLGIERLSGVVDFHIRSVQRVGRDLFVMADREEEHVHGTD